MELLRVSPRSPKAWKTTIDTLSTFLTEVTFHFTERGVWLQALDPSMVVFVSVEAPRHVFSTYELKHPEVKVPVSLVDYQRILSRLSPGETLMMSFSSTNLYVFMEGKGIKKEFVLPALDVRETAGPVSFPEPAASVTLPAQQLKDALRNALIVSRHVTFRTSGNSFVVEAREGSSVARTEVSPAPGVRIESSTEAVSTYSVDYLQNILKGAEGEVTLEYASDSPLRVEYSVEGIRLVFVLAPLIL